MNKEIHPLVKKQVFQVVYAQQILPSTLKSLILLKLHLVLNKINSKLTKIPVNTLHSITNSPITYSKTMISTSLTSQINGSNKINKSLGLHHKSQDQVQTRGRLILSSQLLNLFLNSNPHLFRTYNSHSNLNTLGNQRSLKLSLNLKMRIQTILSLSLMYLLLMIIQNSNRKKKRKTKTKTRASSTQRLSVV